MEKKPILNIMVDLETTAKSENAGILSWAMVAFATDGEDIPEFTFDRVVTLRSCFFAGMKVEVDTQEWWDKQSPQAKHHILTGEADSIRTVAKDAYMQLEALAESHDIYLWSRGIDFDLPKIKWCFEHLLEKDERDFPFKFSHKMDVRTVLKFMQIDQSQFEFKGVQHHSVDDCMHDIRMIQEAYKWKEKWMMAYTAVEAGKTAKNLKEDRSTTESEQGCTKPSLPQISNIIGTPAFEGSSLYLNEAHAFKIETVLQCMYDNLKKDRKKEVEYLERIKDLEKELEGLRETCQANQEEIFDLRMQLKDLQAKG